MKFLNKIRDIISCLLHEHCEYSIKKILTYLFSVVTIYVIIFTDKDYYYLLGFITLLLGIRGWERFKLWGTPQPPKDVVTDDSALDNQPNKVVGWIKNIFRK